MSWRAALFGDIVDLHVLTVGFPAARDPHIGQRDDGQFFLCWSGAESLHEIEAIAASARSVLDIVNGIARTLDPSYRPVCLTGHYADATANRHEILQSDVLEVRDHADSVVPIVGERAPPNVEQPEPHYFKVAANDVDVAEALTVLGRGQLDWSELYKVFEIVRANCGGDKALQEALGVPRARLSAFTGSANHPAVSGRSARHSRGQGGTPKYRLSLGEGRAFISGLVDSWISAKRAD